MSPVRTERPTDQQVEDAKRSAARAFDAAVREAGITSNEAVGAAIGVGETRACKLRSDADEHLDVVPNTAQMILAPTELFEAWLARIHSEREKVHGPRVPKSLEALMLASLQAEAKVTQVSLGALADGVVTEPEIPAIETEMDRSDVARAAVRKALRARARR